MKFKLFLLFTYVIICAPLLAQNVPIIEVPNEIEFAGMKLKVSSSAKQIIQKDITNISKNAKYFQSLVERANMYFPLIEKVFEEEGFPKDFKFLALQESSLIADAVSKSNAVGYWQFKKESAIEVGLRVDNKIDERMNIIASSRGAARYLKRNNQTFDNWVYSLLSYNLGLGGAKSQIDQSYISASKMPIDDNTHWYVLRFLAHKLVYQHAIGNSVSVDSVLVEYINGSNKSIEDIAQETKLDKTRLQQYNKWLKIEVIPEDKIYPVVLAVPMSQAAAFTKGNSNIEVKKGEKPKTEKFPSVADIDFQRLGNIAYTLVVNGVRAIMARNGDNSVKLSAQGNITKQDFLKYNEMKSFEDVKPGKVYYLKSKKNKALVMFHTAQYGETIWDIAQNYGIKTDAIRDKNRMNSTEALVPGRVLWLRKKRPKNSEIEYKSIEPKPSVNVIENNKISMDTFKLNTSKTTGDSKVVSPTVEINADKYDYKYHTVETGETLFGIAKKYNLATDSIMEWNNLENYNLKTGQNIIVEKKTKNNEPISYIVVPGDTFYKIAKQFGVTVNELIEWNNKTDTNVKPGEKLFINKK